MDLNQVVFATSTNSVFLQKITPVISESIQSIFTPLMNETIQNTVENAIEPLVSEIKVLQNKQYSTKKTSLVNWLTSRRPGTIWNNIPFSTNLM